MATIFFADKAQFSFPVSDTSFFPNNKLSGFSQKFPSDFFSTQSSWQWLGTFFKMEVPNLH